MKEIDSAQNGEGQRKNERKSRMASKFHKRNPCFFFIMTIMVLYYSSTGSTVEAFSSVAPGRAIQLRSASTNRNTPTYNVKFPALRAVTATAPLDLEDGPKSLVNDFQPVQMTLTESMVFFAKYLVVHQKEQAIKKQLLNPNRKRSKLWPFKQASIESFSKLDAARLRAEVKQEKLDKKTFRETLKVLDESRKELIELVGYDSKLLVSSFGFAMIAAFMNSVIPHYYGQSVNCLANALITPRTEVITALTGLGIASVLCALFTGIRGALFWLAGTSMHIYSSLFVAYTLPFSNARLDRLSWKLQYSRKIA
jgi:hypothetical protein